MTPVEIPILNLIASPFFIFGETFGVAFSNLILLIINIQLTYLCHKVWKEAKVLDRKVEEAILLFPLISLFLYFGKFMPDIISVLLILYGLCLAINKNKIITGLILSSLSLLIKPTSVIVYALLLLMKDRSKIKHYIWISISVVITLIYYKVINPLILEFAGEHSFFAVGPKPFMVAISQFFGSPLLYFKIFLNSLFGKWMILPFLILIIFNFIKKETTIARISFFSIIILLQSTFLHLLSGNHPYMHNYYYIGISPIVCIFVYSELSRNKNVLRIFKLLLAFTVFLQAIYDLKPVLKPYKKRAWQLRSECKQLKSQTKEFPWDSGYHFRSTFESYPTMGVCFGEIQNAKQTKYGFFYKDKGIPKDCNEVASSKHLILAKCL